MATKIKSSIDGVFPATIVVDTREQLPYLFRNIRGDVADKTAVLKVLTTQAKLDAGDYSIVGHEGRVAVERKSLADLYQTLTKGRDRFERELERLQSYTVAAVAVEANWYEILNEPPNHTRVKPKTIFRSVVALTQRYPNVHWWMMDNRACAEALTFRILQRYWIDLQSKEK